jgi:hypothetical protein
MNVHALRFGRVLVGHRDRLVFLGCLALGAATTLYASVGRWDWYSLGVALPQGWMVGGVLFWALALDPSGNGHRDRIARWSLWSTWPALALQQLAYVQTGRRWDAAFLIGWLSLLIGLELAVRARDRTSRALRRLVDRRALDIAGADVIALLRGLDRAGRRWAVGSASAAAATFMLTWPRAGDFMRQWHSWSFGLAATDQILVVVAAATAAAWMGRMAAYGRLGGFITRRGLPLRVIPGHPDGAGGLKPVGDLFLYQSLTASLPAIFTAVWILLVSLGRANPALGHYAPFLDQYLWLLAFTIAFQALVFLLPMLSMHVIMLRQKAAFHAEADRLSRDIEAARTALNSENSNDDESAPTRISRLVERYQALETAPTWPIDPSIRRRFTVRNVGLAIPFVGSLVGATSTWQELSTQIGRLISP